MTFSTEPPGPELFRTNGHLPECVHLYWEEPVEPVGASARFAPGTLYPDRKTFLMYRYESGEWLLGLNGRALPLYNLPAVRAALARGETVLNVEGEKCVDRLTACGLVATTNPFGAEKWRERDTAVLRCASVVLMPDNDAIGRRHMLAVAQSLHAVGATVRLLEFAGLEPGGDVADWLDAGGTRQKLVELYEATPIWTPPASTSDQWEDPVPFAAASEPEPFPISTGLTPLLQDLAQQTAETVKVDPIAPAVLAPTVGSAAAGNVYRMRVSPTHYEPNLSRYAILSLPSGERKSATFRRVAAPLDVWMSEEEPGYRSKLADAKADAHFYRKQAEYAETKAAREKKAEMVAELQEKARQARAHIPPLPRRPLLYIGDTTQEALVRQMAACGGASAVLSADARHVADAVLGRHRKDGGIDDSVYLRAHGGDRIDRSRVGNSAEGEFVGIDQPALALCICMQPDKLAELAGRTQLIESGFLPRCNLAAPRSLVGERIEAELELPLDPRLAAEWQRVIRAIVDERFRIIDLVPAGYWTPVELVLDPEAMELRRAFANEIELRQGPNGDLRGTAGFASKAAGEAARLAGIMHLLLLAQDHRLGEAADIPVPGAVWNRAETNQRWQLAESLRVLSLAVEDQQTRTARRVLDWVARDPEQRHVIAARDVVGARIVDSAHEAEEIFRFLEERRWVRPAELGKKERSPRWQVHPLARKGPCQ